MAFTLYIVTKDGCGELRNIVSGIALPGDVKGACFVLREPLDPIDQENECIIRGPLVTALIIVRRCVGVGEPNTGR